jgi:predicted MPP superfamily phosphohydrolase
MVGINVVAARIFDGNALLDRQSCQRLHRNPSIDAFIAVRDDVLRKTKLACLGNHDTGAYHAGRPVNAGALRRLLRALEGAGVDTLENESRAMVRSGARLSVGGYGDLWSGRFAPDALPAPDLALSHNPDTAPRLAASGAKVILSGHTHGGQVRVPLLGAPYVPVRHKEFLAGPYRIGDTHLHVNPGLGYSYRVRFCARPEVTLLTLAAC